MYALSGKISEGTMRETFRKTFDQIADLPNSYLAVDDIEIGMETGYRFGCLAVYINGFRKNKFVCRQKQK